eukprot:1332256-Pyramimonas_sp.AAC.1
MQRRRPHRPRYGRGPGAGLGCGVGRATTAERMMADGLMINDCNNDRWAEGPSTLEGSRAQ